MGGASYADLRVSEGSLFLACSGSHLTLPFPPSLPFPLGISDAYYCAECTRLEKDRDGCPKIVNLGASRTDLFYERRRLGMFAPLPTACRRQSDRLVFLAGFKKG